MTISIAQRSPQGLIIPRLVGSKWLNVLVQLPSAGTGKVWMWYTMKQKSELSSKSLGLKCVPKGPYAASEGKPERLMVKRTPVPLAGTVPETVPVMTDPVRGSNSVSGRVAVNVAPAVFCWATASPRRPGYVRRASGMQFFLLMITHR